MIRLAQCLMVKQSLIVLPDDVKGHSSFYQFHNGGLSYWQSLLSGNGHNQESMPVGHKRVQVVKQRTLGHCFITTATWMVYKWREVYHLPI